MPITKADFYLLGLSGDENSVKKRHALAKSLGLPSKISANMLLSVVNRILTPDELAKLCDELSKTE